MQHEPLVEVTAKVDDALSTEWARLDPDTNFVAQKSSWESNNCLLSNRVKGEDVRKRPNASADGESAASISVLGKYVMF